MFAYGVLVEAQRLVLERRTLALRGWPEAKRGYKIAVLSDLHLLTPTSIRRGKRAVQMALEAEPDIVILPGDLVQHWTPEIADVVREVLLPLTDMHGAALAVPGNHDSRNQPIEWMGPVLKDLGIRLLLNEQWNYDGITWVGVDSASEERARPDLAMTPPPDAPAIAIWHEPDLVSLLPPGCVLQISGHSHGGQFVFPGGYAPVHSDLGRRYPTGFYPDTKTPLYVSRGIGTTLLPARFLCAPEVSLLTLVPA